MTTDPQLKEEDILNIMHNTESNNDTQEIQPELTEAQQQETALVNYVESIYDDKQLRFYIYQTLGKTIKDSAILCGYSELYGYQLARKMRNNPKWLEKLKPLADNLTAEYKTHHKIALPVMWQVKLNALEKMRSDPELVIKNPKLLRDMEQIAEAIEGEKQPTQVVNVDKMQVIIQGNLGMKSVSGNNDGLLPDNSE